MSLNSLAENTGKGTGRCGAVSKGEFVMRIVERTMQSKRGLLAAVGATAALAFTATFTLGGFNASIENSSSTFSSGTIQLEEGNGVTTCYSTGSGSGGTVSSANTNTSCAINGLGGTLDQVPGGTALSTTITLTNVGNDATTGASLTVGSCSVANASDANGYDGSDTANFCSHVDVTIANTTSGATDACVYPTQASACPSLSNTYNLATLAGSTFTTTPMSALAVGASATYVIKVQLDGTAADNSDQGLTATLPLTWEILQ